MKELYIRKIEIDWDRLSPESYVREIPALRDLEELEFQSPVTFFVGENGSGAFAHASDDAPPRNGMTPKSEAVPIPFAG